MEDVTKVLIVEGRHARPSVAHRLLESYDVDFRWECVGSTRQLCRIAERFAPDIVLCADDIEAASGHALLDALKLLCRQPPAILVSRLPEVDKLLGRDTAQSPRGAHQRRAEVTAPRSTGDAPSPIALDPVQLVKSFSLLLESSTRSIVMSNAEGWITYANSSACRQLDGTCDRSLGSLLRASSEECPRHRLVYFDAATGHPTPIHVSEVFGCLTARAPLGNTAVALAALDFESLRMEQDAEHSSDPSHPGSIIRITQNDFLVTIPGASRPADAAFAAQHMLESMGGDREAIRRRPDINEQVRVPPRTCRPRVRDGIDAPPETKKANRFEIALGEAIQRRALSVQYQPQYDLSSGRGCGVEALARWVLCNGEMVPPSVFIPIAERCGLIHDLGAWVLHSACETAAGWYRPGGEGPTVSVNVSALQIDERFCAVIYDALKRWKFPADHLELEITESALVDNTERTIECMKQWKKLGVRIAVDDFGTGYSSLSYLSRLPVDRLKLDQSLIRMMTLDSKSAIVMQSIVSLGAQLGIDVIAEGVETEPQFQMLEALHCPQVQGYLLGRPMPASQAQVILKRAWGNRRDSAIHPGAAAFPRPQRPGPHTALTV